MRENLSTTESLRDALVNALGENLVSIVRYRKAETKVHVLVVARQLVDADWRSIADAFEKLKGRANVEPVLLTEQAWRSSTDIFPILIREINKGYEVVHGQDIMSGMSIERAHLRLRCEQELRSLQIRMQSICLMHFASPHRLRQAIVQDFKSFEELLEVAVELSDESEVSSDEQLRYICEEFELELNLLQSASEFAEGTGVFDEETFGAAYIELMSAVRMTANLVDQLPDE
jgi:hypothetical protein